jgi:putative DNA primase/helicase
MSAPDYDFETNGSALDSAAAVAPTSPGEDEDPGENFRMIPDDWNWTAHKFKQHARPNLIHFQDAFYDWKGGAYEEVEPSTLKSQINHHLVRSRLINFSDRNAPFKTLRELDPPDKHTIEEVMASLARITHKDRLEFAAPCFLGAFEADVDPTLLVAFPNCIFDPMAETTFDPSPRFFTFNVMPFDYVRDGPPPKVWLETLNQWWRNDPDCIKLLQEAFGYTVFGSDTSLHKIFQLHGPTRSGKGTIIRVLIELLGKRNVANRSLKQLGGEFPLQSAIHKRAMIIAEARTSRRIDLESVAQVLISVSGEDLQDVGRKHLPDWKGDLPLVIWMSTNTALTFPDSSAALATRIAVIPMTENFDGREDHDLDIKLKAELPGIFLWAHEGWKRLRDNGKKLTRVASGDKKREEMKALGSEELAFTNDRCVLDAKGFVHQDDLIKAWLSWRCESGRTDEAKVPAQFVDAFVTLHAPRGVRPNTQVWTKPAADQPRKQIRAIKGVRLKTQADLFEGAQVNCALFPKA